MSNYYIYTISCPITNQVVYVGKSLNWASTLERYRHNNGTNPVSHWINETRLIGLNPIIEIIDDSLEFDNNFKDDVEKAIYHRSLEKYWINQFIAWGFNLKNIQHVTISDYHQKVSQLAKERRLLNLKKVSTKKALQMSIDISTYNLLKAICDKERRSISKTLEILIEKESKLHHFKKLI